MSLVLSVVRAVMRRTHSLSIHAISLHAPHPRKSTDTAVGNPGSHVDTHPSMQGFSWSERMIDPAKRLLPGDLWCVRDAFCQLMGWPPGSNEWHSFIEDPIPGDVERLVDHLGLCWVDPTFPDHRQTYLANLDHPGVAIYALHAVKESHAQFQPHIRCLRPLPAAYSVLDPNPELFRIIIDVRQPPRGHAPML